MDIQSSFEDVDDVTKKLSVTVPAEQIAQEVKKEIDRLASTARLKGFRPGKAPRHMIEKLHGERARLEVANRMISASLHDVLKDSEIKVVGMPEIENTSFEAGQPLTYTAKIFLFPEPEIKDYDKFQVKVFKAEVTDEDVQREVGYVLESKATLKEITDRKVARDKDVINATFQAAVEGQEPSRPEPQAIGLGEGRLPEELEKGLLGMEVGETRHISVKMSADHPNNKLRNKTVDYTVELQSISEKVLPELTDQFVASLDRDEKTVLELKVGLRELLEEAAEKQAKERVHEAVLEQLLERNPFPIPQPIVDDEIRSILVRAGLIDPNKTDPSRIDVTMFRENFGEAAEKRARIAIMVDRLGEMENLQATDEDLDKYAEEVSQHGSVAVEDVKKWLLNNDRRMATMLELSRDKVLKFLEERAEVEYTSEEEKKDQELEAKPEKKTKAKSKSKAKAKKKAADEEENSTDND